ncbi:MAG: ABC transporter ATP-binding protein, partial [Candidatus Kariarchaeaceae archaeon]
TYAKRLQPVSLDRQQRLAKINTGLQENLTGIRVVRTFSAQEREAQQFESQVRSYEDVLVERGAISAYYIPILLLSLLTSLIFLLGVYIIEANEQGLSSLPVLGLNIPIQPLSVGDLIAFLTLMGILVFPTQILRFLLDVITLGFAGSSRIYTTLTTQSILEKGADLPLENIKGDITFTNVTFAYEEGARPAVIDLSFDLKAGETLAVIGPTGSGKTTIGKLLLRLYDIDEGSISIDSLEVNQIEINHLRSQVGMIEQDIMLFSASIRANIAYGVPNLTDEEIEAAAKAAQAHDFIMSFPDGYDTIIGEKGVTLSGGQRQRVAMARTFVTNPKILVMDDSTSAIDAQTEAKISAAMEGLLKNRTTIIITHRLATLKNADKILFLRNGTAEKIGTHEELIASFEPYRQIFGAYQELPPLEVDN